MEATGIGKTQGYREYYREMNEQLVGHMPALATALLGLPQSRTATQWRYGKKLNLVINMEGSRKGQYYDFETRESGDALELVKKHTGYQGKDLGDWVRSFTGWGQGQTTTGNKSLWVPIVPIPDGAAEPDIGGNRYLNYMLRDGAKETHRHAYCDEASNLKGYVVRIEKIDGSKITPPLAWCINEKGFKAWKWQAFEKENRTPYRIERLATSPGKPVLIVEGEKTADAAQKIFPNLIVLSWMGGVGSVHLTSWDCLAGRRVILWPDNDSVGIQCMQRLRSILEEKGITSLYTAILPPSTPQGWDLADCMPPGWTEATLNKLISIQE